MVFRLKRSLCSLALIRVGMLNARRRWKIKGITSVDAAVARNKREILAIYIRIVASGKKKMRRRMER